MDKLQVVKTFLDLRSLSPEYFNRTVQESGDVGLGSILIRGRYHQVMCANWREPLALGDHVGRIGAGGPVKFRFWCIEDAKLHVPGEWRKLMSVY